MRIIPADLRAGFDGVYRPEDRAIFGFGRGSDLRADPLGIAARLATGMADLDAEALAQQLDPTAALNRRLYGLRRLLPVLREVFDLHGFAADRSDGATARELFDLHVRFLRYRDRITARYRLDAEWSGTFGTGSGSGSGVMPYERRVGLAWNLTRVRAFPAVAVWQGMVAATGAGPIPFALADALAPSRAEAAELAERLEADRLAAEARLKAPSRSSPSG